MSASYWYVAGWHSPGRMVRYGHVGLDITRAVKQAHTHAKRPFTWSFVLWARVDVAATLTLENAHGYVDTTIDRGRMVKGRPLGEGRFARVKFTARPRVLS